MDWAQRVPPRQRCQAGRHRLALFWCALASLLTTSTGDDVKFPLWTAGTNVAGQLGAERGLGTSQTHVTPVRLNTTYYSESFRGQVVVALSASKGHTIVQTISNATIADVQYAGTKKCDPTSGTQRSCSTFIW